MDVSSITGKVSSLSVDDPATSEALRGDILPQFPPLPTEGYCPSPTGKATIRIPRTEHPAPHEEDLDINHLIQTAWAAVLAAQTNSPEVVYGLAHHGRKTYTGEQSVMPFRFQVRPDDTVQEALAEVASLCEYLEKWEHLGLARFRAMNPGNLMASEFRNLLVIEHGKRLGRVPYSEGYALTVACAVLDEEVGVQALFDPVVISESPVDLILELFCDVLLRLLSGSVAVLRDLEEIGAEGMQRIAKWNEQASNEKKTPMILELIEQKFKDNPSAAAVSAWDGSLTYQELDGWSSSIAAQLTTQGVKPGTFVGIYMRKSVLAVVGLMAIIKAGGGFVFLHPSLPIRRLQLICEKTPIHLVLCGESTQGEAIKLGQKIQITHHSDKDYEPKGRTSRRAQSVQSNSHHPLYAVYTSGSTGEPKGVVVDRGSYSPGIKAFCSALELDPTSRVFQGLPYASVVSIHDTLITLAAGACICVPSEEQVQNNTEAAICQFKATWGVLTPSMARTLSPARITSLKTLNLAGEPVHQSDWDKWSPHLTVNALYGQTESATSLVISNVDSLGLGHITTGACWIVDPEDHSRLPPIGVQGELMIESTALATGYVNSPGESAKTFVEMPAWLCKLRPHGHRARCLLTGDIARYVNTSGTIRLIGRKDTAAKIRGQRVQVGEVESHLRRRFPGAESVIVEVIQPAGRATSQSILVAFISGLSTRADADPSALLAPTTSEFRSQAQEAIDKLREVLPSFMIPSAIVLSGAVPTTATGKTHRKVLRESMSNLTLDEILAYSHKATVPYRAPATREEKLIQSMCEEVLHLPASSISLEDDFFDVGGDSLTVRQLVSMVRSQGGSLTVADVFEAPRLANLAVHLGQSSLTVSSTLARPVRAS